MAFTFDYSQTINQAKELENLAADMERKTAKRLDEVCNTITAAWSGDAAKVFLEYLVSIEEGIQMKAVYIKNTAEFLRTAAKQMKQAENEAKSHISKI